MITKQCQGCGMYFVGQFDGDYTCPSCHEGGIQAPRQLSPLAAGFGDWTAAHAEAPHKAPGHAPEPAGSDATPKTARGQAA